MFLKKVAAVSVGVALSFVVGLIAITGLNSENPAVLYPVMLAVIAGMGALLIGGGYIAAVIGREICERALGWFL